ncbi:hypothetical protein J5N97_018940 [Dioscorea zingiberensis]|uniref:Wax synthase domain-containing protein n=1 Tax=Dioscorea zingiberensis TaxID=325984 RepID=A0A9D5HBX9_9LILI|nr:hypothetical protein J5N97_018940 [Dioscorea zingiberensis]
MNGEMNNFIKLLLWITTSMTYARFISSKLPPGRFRLAALLPVLSLLPLLPWSFSSIQLRAIFFFFLTWLSLFKLLLLSFGHGPLHPSLPLPTFITISSLPIKLRDKSSPFPPLNLRSLLLGITIKTIFLSGLISLYAYKPIMHPYLLLFVYFTHMSIALEVILSIAAFFGGAVIGLDLEPQFNSPFGATSLEDYWGRRWNLMVTSILRPTVYNPVRARFGVAAGVLATFLVSGVMHELMAYYFTSEAPTWEATCYFLLHGVCLVGEKWVKGLTGVRLTPVVSGALTMVFMLVTSFWLLFAPLLRSDAEERLVEESVAALGFLKDIMGHRIQS